MSPRLDRFFDRVEWRIIGARWLPQAAIRWAHDALMWVERVVYAHHNAQVLADMEYRFGCVLSWVTRGMSKAYYDLEDMSAEIQAHLNEERDDAVAEAMEPAHQARPAGEWTSACGNCLWWKRCGDEEDPEVAPYLGPLNPGMVELGFRYFTSLPSGIGFPAEDHN